MTSPTKSTANGYTLPQNWKHQCLLCPLWILEVIWSPCGYNVLALILHEKLPTWSLTYNMKRLCCRSRLRYNQLSLGLYKVAQLIVLEVSMIGKIAVGNLWQTPGKGSQHRSLRNNFYIYTAELSHPGNTWVFLFLFSELGWRFF